MKNTVKDMNKTSKICRAVSAMAVVALLICGCATSDKEKNVKEEAHKGTTSESGDAAEKNDQGNPKLSVVEPVAYQTVSELDLEEGAVISVVGKGSGDQFWGGVEKGVKQAAKDLNDMLGYTGKSQIKVTYSGTAVKGDVDQQVNILDEELARYPVAISIAISDTQACGVQFDIAGQGDIPIVAFDSGSDYPGINAIASTDNMKTSQMAADRLADLMNSSGEVILFVHDSKSQTASDREKGFLTQMEEMYPEIHIGAIYCMDQLKELKNEMVETRQFQGTAEEIKETDVVNYLLSKHPDVKGVYATSAEAVKLALSGLEDSGLAPFFVGYDGDEEELNALRSGKIDGLIVQNPYAMGYVAVVAAARAALKMGNEAFINTGHVWVTKENIDSEEVKKLLY